MKIEKIEIMAVNVPFKGKTQDNVGEISLGKWQKCRFIVVKVYTDDGIIGYGESAPWVRTSELGQGPVIAVLKDYLGPAIIGMNPFDIELIWKTMDRIAHNNPQAKGILDMALYDIMGKAVGMPMYNLIGGAVRKEIPLAPVVTIDTLDSMKRSTRRWIESGFKTIRIKLGLGDIKKDIELVKEIRKEIGPNIKLRVDPNQAYSLKEALRIINVLEENDVEIYEQPIVWNDIDGLARINKSTYIPVMPHEAMKSINDVREFINKGSASLLTIKTDRPGGITKARIARDIAELYNIPCVVMSSIELSISTCASMQFAATIKNLNFACEASGIYEIEDIADNSKWIVNGNFIVPDKPGFGVEIDDEKLAYFTEQIVECNASSVVLD